MLIYSKVGLDGVGEVFGVMFGAGDRVGKVLLAP